MAAYLNHFNSELNKFLHEKHRGTELLEKAEKLTGIKRLYMVQGLGAFTALYLIFGYFAALICNLVGFVYPAWQSIKTLETESREDDTKWLTYWVVFAFFSTMEFYSDTIFSWFPFYWVAKIGFLIWCFAPIERNGSMVVYHRFIRPVFNRHVDVRAKKE